MGINFAEEQVLDATTLLYFCNIIEENGIGKKLFNGLKMAFDVSGVIYHGGTIVDVTLISAPTFH